MILITHTTEVTHEWVMSYVWMSHVTHQMSFVLRREWLCREWVMSQILTTSRGCKGVLPRIRTRSHMWTSHVTHRNDSCHSPDVESFVLELEWVCPKRVMSQVLTTCHVYKGVMSHTHTRSHIRASHATHMKETCHSSGGVSFDSRRAWVCPKRVMSQILTTCHIYTWVMLHIRTGSRVWKRHVTHMNESCCSSSGVSLVFGREWMSHARGLHETCPTYKWVMSHIQTSHVTHANESCHTYK